MRDDGGRIEGRLCVEVDRSISANRDSCAWMAAEEVFYLSAGNGVVMEAEDFEVIVITGAAWDERVRNTGNG